MREHPYVATYHWMHIQTTTSGRTTKLQGTSVYQGQSRLHMLVFLNTCNAQNPGTWQYWY